jgi:transcriptional regulator with XRE-family HTH domain
MTEVQKFLEARRAAGMTTAQVAVAANCSARTVEKCDRGYRPRALIRASIARVLGVDETELWGEER